MPEPGEAVSAGCVHKGVKEMKRDSSLDLERQVSRVLVRIMRFLHGGPQRKLAADSGVSPSTIATAERGRHTVSRRVTEKLGATVGMEPPELELLTYALHEFYARRAGAPLDHPLPAGLRRRENGWEETAVGLARAFDRLLARNRPGATRPAEAQTPVEGREHAAGLWDRLSSYPEKQRRALVLKSGTFRVWDLGALLCDLSLEAAAESPARAIGLAELALLIARLSAADPARSTALQAWAHAHLGNGLRAGGNHQPAARELGTAHELRAASAETFDRLFLPARLLGFKASLLRDQRQFGPALAVLEAALAIDDGREAPYLVINKAKLLRDMGDLEAALATLEHAEPHLAAAPPRLLFTARFNRMDYLTLLERYTDAEEQLPEILSLAGPHAAALERLRLNWVAGRVAAGTGRIAEGIAALERVRREFAARGMTYDAALAALELASLHLEQGETSRVKALVREMLPAFQSRDIHREALAALRLFRQAAEQERATAELAREVARFLHRARHNPDLRFPRAAPAPGV
jgi:transcriptional regulator with XRE-family HTH domain